jgi:ABC-type Mn2+/Zn2+ transport system ATPase subunit
MSAYTQTNLINTTLVLFFSSDLLYNIFHIIKKKDCVDKKDKLNFKKYLHELNIYINKYKINVIWIVLIIIFNALLGALVQYYQIKFTSKLFLGKVRHWELIQLSILFLIDIWSDQLSIKMNKLLINPIKIDCKNNFLLEIKNSKIENLDNKVDHELIQAMNKKVTAIKASPQCIKQLCRAIISLMINTISISSINIIWAIQILIITYLYFRYVCWSKLESNKKLQKKDSDNEMKLSKEINYIFQDIKSFHQFNNINKKTNHLDIMKNLTEKSYDFKLKINIEWNTYIKLMQTISKFSWILIAFQIINNLNYLPKEKISIVLTACGYLSWNLNWISESMTVAVNDIASYQTYLDFIKELNKTNINLKHINLQINKESVNISDKEMKKGFNMITGKSGSGKTTFLKNLFFTNKNLWNRIAYLYQNSRHEFSKKTPQESIIGMNNLNQIYFDNVYKCIELNKNSNKELEKPSGGEVQKMKIGIVLYQAMLIDAKLIILDEPDNNIDVESFNKIMINIKNLFNDSIILFTTHKGDSLNFESNMISINEFNL